MICRGQLLLLFLLLNDKQVTVSQIWRQFNKFVIYMLNLFYFTNWTWRTLHFSWMTEHSGLKSQDTRPTAKEHMSSSPTIWYSVCRVFTHSTQYSVLRPFARPAFDQASVPCVKKTEASHFFRSKQLDQLFAAGHQPLVEENEREVTLALIFKNQEFILLDNWYLQTVYYILIILEKIEVSHFSNLERACIWIGCVNWLVSLPFEAGLAIFHGAFHSKWQRRRKHI